MPYRRIVTGNDASGQSVFLSDVPAPRTTAFRHTPGFVASLVWETPPGAMVPLLAADPAVAAGSWLPQPGATNLMFITFPPDSVMAGPDFDPTAAGDEHLQVLPGLAETFERDNPGMHATDSIDYGVLLDGEIYLELDGGATRKLARHDVVIQNGTRHAWRNRSDRPATMLFVFVGARRAEPLRPGK